MKQNFLEFIRDNNLCQKHHKILAAVSGGVDSVVMFHLLKTQGFNVSIAHCNFNLRGKNSDDDELFVSNLASTFEVSYHVKKFNTKEHANKKNESTQMAARELRYQWFEEIRLKYKYDFIAIAHNKNDITETFFINLSRGTGIKGLIGIKPKIGNIIRPILFASRDEILHYLDENQLNYREDASNASLVYKRNKIRHEIIPVFRELNPSFLSTMDENIKRISNILEIYHYKINEILDNIVSNTSDKKEINIKELKKYPCYKNILFEILHEHGFKGNIIEDIARSIDSSPGKQFFSNTHQVIKDRDTLIVIKREEESWKTGQINKNIKEIFEPLHLKIEELSTSESFQMIKDTKIAYLDINKISFPLSLRKWDHGDKFKPLGMKNFKKLSDFFSDNKFSLVDKKNTWLLCTNEKNIAWIIGHRIDDRFKIDKNTRNLLKIELLPKT